MTTRTVNDNNAATVDQVQTAAGVQAFRQDVEDHLHYVLGKPHALATPNDFYLAVASNVRNRLMRIWLASVERFFAQDRKAVCYFSAEFLIGPQLGRNLLNLGMQNTVSEAVKALGLDLKDILEVEREPGLGNGGLGRLAACYMESLASLEIPAIGFGIRYEYGIFEQKFHDGWQIELTDNWLRLGNPWEIPRPERIYDVKLGGHTEQYTNEAGHQRVRWVADRVVRGMAYDTPIVGYQVEAAGMLRLWKAEAPSAFDFRDFNSGNYYGAVEKKVVAENLTKVLYPNDEPQQGKRLRLEQQFFFVSCSLQNLLEMHLLKDPNLENFSHSFVAQLNDTHPAIAIAEMMRLLIDEHGMAWQKAWTVTQNTFCYTNHTLLPEALETWSLPLFASVLPRHLEIIYEINHGFLQEVMINNQSKNIPLDRLSIIDDSGEKRIRMANLACIGSKAINGVAALHTELLQTHTLRDFHEIHPEKFCNVTNGVTPRRWMALSNPRLAELISSKIGSTWIKNLEELRRLEQYADDAGFRAQWREVKRANKRDQIAHARNKTGIEFNIESLFDVQVKRIHEYKRQHLMVLYIITLYNRLRRNPGLAVVPRTFVFGGKAAPGYYMAKLIIKLINSVAEVINRDPLVDDRLRVAFIRNFNVKTAQRIYPIADLSEQISTAGKEASGTGNMKFSMNGALTIGTLDGANVEIMQEVGEENFFLFGLKVDEVNQLKSSGYNPEDYLRGNSELKEVIDLINSGHFSLGNQGLFKPLTDALVYHDEYMLFADYASYIACQDRVNQVWQDQELWTRMAILNVARMGKFSSDRSIRDYCRDVWHIDLQEPK
jgi:starch phosphorylase